MTEPAWLHEADVLRLHEEALKEGGGQDGFLNRTALPGALARPQHKYHYETAGIFECAAAYAYGIAKAHAFLDGNKRTAFLACVAFLDANGIELSPATEDAVDAMESLTDGRLTEGAFSGWLAARAS